MFFRKQPEPEPEPEIVIEKSEQLDGKISGISLGLESRGHVSGNFHPSMYSIVHFSSKELQPLVKALNALLAQIHWIENGQEKTE